ncbi:Grx4 family monothiol glutaredoxin [Luteimonas terricola]|uniref:Glutaredoxin-like protein n=1 Tax=Luteimonas terricola TaxID=645597 RepID=A0ABQ2EL03_9GAMM|nr:Grx4 family monothiol glutaredoxin [Luteimonas terricola]GGK14923.1 glutaredoxin-like protein [Luteimonas terricola]
MTLAPDLRQRIEDLLQANRIVLFMKGDPRAPQCGFSAKAVAALSSLEQPFAHVNVLADADIREGIKAYGNWPTIPQLYIGGELVGGSDIIEQMANSGELHAAVGLPPPDRTPPTITVTPVAHATLRKAIDDAGGDLAVKIDIDPRFRTRLALATQDAKAISVDCDGITVQVELAAARRADGIVIDFADDARGRGLVIENPNAPPPVRALSPTDVHARVSDGSLRLVDVRPAEERASATAPVPHATLDDGPGALEGLPRDTPLAFLCHHGTRSAQAAEHFRQLGFREVYSIEGGIDAWADVDAEIPRY